MSMRPNIGIDLCGGCSPPSNIKLGIECSSYLINPNVGPHGHALRNQAPQARQSKREPTPDQTQLQQSLHNAADEHSDNRMRNRRRRGFIGVFICCIMQRLLELGLVGCWLTLLQTLVLTPNLHCNATYQTLRFIHRRFNGWDLLTFCYPEDYECEEIPSVEAAMDKAESLISGVAVEVGRPDPAPAVAA
jgi:hypothetical protein